MEGAAFRRERFIFRPRRPAAHGLLRRGHRSLRLQVRQEHASLPREATSKQELCGCKLVLLCYILFFARDIRRFARATFDSDTWHTRRSFGCCSSPPAGSSAPLCVSCFCLSLLSHARPLPLVGEVDAVFRPSCRRPHSLFLFMLISQARSAWRCGGGPLSGRAVGHRRALAILACSPIQQGSDVSATWRILSAATVLQQ